MDNLDRLKAEVFQGLTLELQRDINNELKEIKDAITHSNERNGICDYDNENQKEIERAQRSLLEEYKDIESDDGIDDIESEEPAEEPVNNETDESEIQATNSQDEEAEQEEEYCNENALENDCESCEHLTECMDGNLKLTVQIPYFIIDNYLPNLSRPATKVLFFLARRANFAKDNTHFGRCWASHKQIEDATNVKVSNLNKYLLELVRLNLITKTTNTRNIDGKIISINQYTVTWFKRMNDLKIKAIAKKQANKKKSKP